MLKLRLIADSDSFTVERTCARGIDRETVSIDAFNRSIKYTTDLVVFKEADYNKIWDTKEYPDNKLCVMYTNNRKVCLLYGEKEAVINKLITVKSFSPKSTLNKNGLTLYVRSCIQNVYKLDIEGARIYIDDNNYREFDPKVSSNTVRRRNYFMSKSHKFNFKLEDLYYEDATFNCSISAQLKVMGIWVSYPILKGYLNKYRGKNEYVPSQAIYTDDWALHLRNTKNGNLVLVRRPCEAIELTKSFRFKENWFVSGVLYYLSNFCHKFNRENTNLYFEKFSSKAEEGTFEIFEKAKNKRSYFIIDPTSPDYERIKDVKNVIPKFSWRYYWILFQADNVIATETPSHVNILRAMNKYVRKATYKVKFIFLQHGVTYLKRQGPTTTFVKGKEGYPDYIVVNSQKESDIVSEMLNIPEERILNTGMPIFNNIKWESMNKDSADKVTIMLTWKPYEEFITNFEHTSYYKNTIAVYELVKKYVADENITVIAHPKIASMMKGTDFGNHIWDKPISEALCFSKLLITDYSSVCYNSFYQGGGVIFYQPDLDYYENYNGKLIPKDEEYIGHRVFDIEALEGVLKKGINNKQIDLDYFRDKKFVDNYLTINEFTDGKNVDRIVKCLEDKGIL